LHDKENMRFDQVSFLTGVQNTATATVAELFNKTVKNLLSLVFLAKQSDNDCHLEDGLVATNVYSFEFRNTTQ